MNGQAQSLKGDTAMKNALSVLLLMIPLLASVAQAQTAGDDAKTALVEARCHYEFQLRDVNKDLDGVTTGSGENSLKEASDMFQDVLKKMQEAIAAGVPESFVIHCQHGGFKDITIADLKAKAENMTTVLSSMTNYKEFRKERLAAKWKPYEDVLSGDKLSFFNENHRRGVNVYGVGGKLLRKPADFKDASVMYYYGVNRDGLHPRWELTGTRFDGNKKTGTSTSSGNGDSPPSKAFK
jgi:hypothetical protein